MPLEEKRQNMNYLFHLSFTIFYHLNCFRNMCNLMVSRLIEVDSLTYLFNKIC